MAGLGAPILAWMTARATRKATGNRRIAIWAAAAFPFVCLGWAGAVFVFDAVINVAFLHRDVGIGDGFDCPLPNGYALSFIDTTDIGMVYELQSWPPWNDVHKNAVKNVRFLQLAGSYILGSSDSRAFEHFGQQTEAVDSYFLLDAKTSKRQDFTTYDALDAAARELNIQAKLVPISSLYSKYRPTWFDAFASVLLLGPPLIGALVLSRWVLRLRRTRVNSAQSA